MSLYEVTEAASLIQEEAHEDANIIFGAVLDEKMKDEVKITVIATGFQRKADPAFAAAAAAAAAPAPTVVHSPTPAPDLEIPAFLRRLQK